MIWLDSPDCQHSVDDFIMLKDMMPRRLYRHRKVLWQNQIENNRITKKEGLICLVQ